ncbi:3'-5' exoribonuclease 1 [Linnemannia elongata]|nr:3'-5' exoribonuclease 1 [Linnemannia elongata]KAG0079160.1 3'-5' exoribonuclease 1 [Linnemannia elongata]
MAVVDDIREQLKQLGLDTRGNKSTLKARLRKHLKKDVKTSTTKENNSSDDDNEDKEESTTSKSQKEQEQEQDAGQSQKKLHHNCRYDYYLCFDVEATCELGFRFEFPSEVIEFPVVLLDGSTLEIVDEFHSYVRPIHRPILSDFCKELTGISQETVDNAPTFVEVLARFEDWLTSHRIILPDHDIIASTTITAQSVEKKVKSKKSKNNQGNPSNLKVANAVNDFQYGATYCFVTDGPFDIRDFISKQCLHSNILRPSYFAHPYIDVRTMFRDYFDLIQWKNLERMLGFLGETFEGRQHSGICDARMVALIAKRLAQGFRRDQNDPIFQEENTELVAPQWSYEKMEKFKEGCVLKANRSTNNTFIKMISFKKVAQIEALPSAIAAGKAAPPIRPKPPTGSQGNKDADDDEGSDNVPAVNAFSLPSPAESEPTSPAVETFVSQSKFSALSMNSE